MPSGACDRNAPHPQEPRKYCRAMTASGVRSEGQPSEPEATRTDREHPVSQYIHTNSATETRTALEHPYAGAAAR